MKVVKEEVFSPITITLETPEEVHVVMQVLYMRLDLSKYIPEYHKQNEFLEQRKAMFDTLDKKR